MSQAHMTEHRGSTIWGDRKSNQFTSNQMLAFGERGKPEYLGENLSEQRSKNQQTKSTYASGLYWLKASALTTAPTLVEWLAFFFLVRVDTY